jgi:hypothetical protein
MLRRTIPVLVMALALLLAGGARAEDAKEILNKAIQAHGGAESLAKYKAARMKATGKVDVLGGLEFTQEIAYVSPDKVRERAEFTVNGMQIIQESIGNADKFSFKVNGMEIALDNVKEAMKETNHLIQVTRLAPLVDKAFEVSVVGDVQVEGKPAIALRVVKAGCKDITLAFDKQTHLLVKSERRATDPQSGMEYVEERFLSDYQKFDGLPGPKKMVMHRDGKKYVEAEVTELKHLETIDDTEFAVP